MDSLFPEFANGTGLCRYHVLARVTRRGEDALTPAGIADALEKAAAGAAYQVESVWTATATEIGMTVPAPTEALALEVAVDVVGEACAGRLDLDGVSWEVRPAGP